MIHLRKYLPHIEALTQNVVGLIIAFCILKAFGMSTEDSIALQMVFFVVSYARSFLIRKLFRYIEESK